MHPTDNSRTHPRPQGRQGDSVRFGQQQQQQHRRMNLMAQEMNNSAASCIEAGCYDRALSSLKRALKLSKLQQQTQSSENLACKCAECSLDVCVSRSKRHAMRGIEEKFRRLKFQGGMDSNFSNICRHPIRVPCQGHIMGNALPLIIVYNIALAHHLGLLQSEIEDPLADRTKKTKETLQVYKVAYEMQANLLCNEKGKDVAMTNAPLLRSIRFEMMILNNIVCLCKDQNESSGYQYYMRRLLATMMIVIDHNIVVRNAMGDNDRIWCIDMDGYTETITPLFLGPESTAKAA